MCAQVITTCAPNEVAAVQSIGRYAVLMPFGFWDWFPCPWPVPACGYSLSSSLRIRCILTTHLIKSQGWCICALAELLLTLLCVFSAGLRRLCGESVGLNLPSSFISSHFCKRTSTVSSFTSQQLCSDAAGLLGVLHYFRHHCHHLCSSYLYEAARPSPARLCAPRTRIAGASTAVGFKLSYDRWLQAMWPAMRLGPHSSTSAVCADLTTAIVTTAVVAYYSMVRMRVIFCQKRKVLVGCVGLHLIQAALVLHKVPPACLPWFHGHACSPEPLCRDAQKPRRRRRMAGTPTCACTGTPARRATCSTRATSTGSSPRPCSCWTSCCSPRCPSGHRPLVRGRACLSAAWLGCIS